MVGRSKERWLVVRVTLMLTRMMSRVIDDEYHDDRKHGERRRQQHGRIAAAVSRVEKET